jgi:hypothetical protein
MITRMEIRRHITRKTEGVFRITMMAWDGIIHKWQGRTGISSYNL